jgi:hypothetical protein
MSMLLTTSLRLQSCWHWMKRKKPSCSTTQRLKLLTSKKLISWSLPPNMNPSIPRAHSLNVFLTPLLVQSATKKELWTIRSSTRSLSSNWLKRTSVKSMNATRTKRRYKVHLKKMQSWELHWSMKLSQWTCPSTSGANTWMRNCQSSRMEKDTTTSRIYKRLSSKDLKHHLQSRSSILFLTTCSGILRDQLARTSISC